MQNEAYWKKRSELLEQQVFDDTSEFLKTLNGAYKTNVVEIEKEIASFITKYATENGLTYQDASKNLTRIEFSEYRSQMNKLWSEYRRTGSDKIKARIKELEAREVVTRLDAIKNQIELRMDILAEDTSLDLEGHLEKVYTESFLQAGEDIAFGLDIDKAFTSANLAVVQQAVWYPYTGMLFSDRIWKCTDKLSSSIIETLQTGLVQGKSIPEMTRDLREKLKGKGQKGYSNYDLTRVVRTEASCILEQARHDASVIYGFKKYYIVVAHDERTCRNCASREGEKHLETERVIGVTAPPFHPQCRCRAVSDPESLE